MKTFNLFLQSYTFFLAFLMNFFLFLTALGLYHEHGGVEQERGLTPGSGTSPFEEVHAHLRGVYLQRQVRVGAHQQDPGVLL